ncbi:hypothetical protein J4Q44_G00211520 [Coregonus suidteri]|uniref:Uncharacterized protein n=1 Tax=Coregonus suidteri TaxID=861788 RepID=A0AAN8QQE0_9TELE
MFFDCILQPSKTGTNRATLQLELHYRCTRNSSCFAVVLNNLRVFLIFDWLQLVREVGGWCASPPLAQRQQ